MMYYVSWAEYRFMREKSKTGDIAGTALASMTRKNRNQGSILTQMVSDNLLPILGAKPHLGRFFTAEEASKPEQGAVVVLSYPFWQKHFGGAMDVAGKSMTLNRTLFTIIGVAEEKTGGPMLGRPDIWAPLSMQGVMRLESFLDKPNVGWIQLLARRRNGVTPAEFQAEMAVLAQQSLQPHLPNRIAMVSAPTAAFFNYPFVKQKGAPVFGVLFVAVSLVLLVACANVANMLLARGLSRRRELAVRLSIGAGCARLVQQLLTESALLSIAGGMLGLLLAQAAAQGMLNMIPSEEIGPLQLNVSADSMVLLYTFGVSIVTAFIFGLLPAWKAVKVDLSPALKSEGLGAIGKRRSFPLQGSLIAVQIAICLVLLVSAGLLLRSLRQAFSMDTGRATRNVLIATFDLEQNRYTPAQAARLILPLRDNMSQAKQVVAASFSDLSPFVNQCDMMGSLLQGDGSVGKGFRYSCEGAGPDYFRTMKIKVLQGRTFDKADVSSNAKVTVVDAKLARMLAADGQVLGRTILLEAGNINSAHEVIGVVGAANDYSMKYETNPRAYAPVSGPRLMRTHLLVQYEGPPLR